MDDRTRTELEAAAFRRLVEHLRERTDVQNIDMMNLAGFCRNCLSRWYREGGERRAEGCLRRLAEALTRAGSRGRALRRPGPVAMFRALAAGAARLGGRGDNAGCRGCRGRASKILYRAD